jgi:hypothetical protein
MVLALPLGPIAGIALVPVDADFALVRRASIAIIGGGVVLIRAFIVIARSK